ncbi:AAA family ATPase [Gordonia sp. HY285]|uniref:McrB family protein n=1 Tax=Gordonia liuliyuniae TaxID=2911517 RepID=UPI001F02F3B3|nr:AAA family ATPase [Gordonia liuliyuniae]MCF8608903.1 AAA family ATPase [Gordonia liuliyuniae]
MPDLSVNDPEYVSMDRPGAPAVEAIGRRILDECIAGRGSLFTPESPVWTANNLDELKRTFVDRPDAGGEDFFTKLTQQLADASSDSVQLFAELFTLNVLPLYDYLGETKIDRISKVLAMCSPSVALPSDVGEALNGRVFRGGRAFMSRRWAQIGFLIEFARYFHTLSDDEQDKALADPLHFRDVVRASPGPSEPAQRQALMYLAFPRFFLPIVSATDRRAIRDGFAVNHLGRPAGDVDIDLHDINEAVMAEAGGPVDFYTSPWKEVWSMPTDAPSPPTDQVQHAWQVYGSNVAGKDMVPVWRTKGIVSLAAKFLRPVDPDIGRDELKGFVEEDYRSSGYAARQVKVDEFYSFLVRMNPGDLIVSISQGRAYFGTVTGDAEFTHSDDDRSNLRRPVKWETQSHPVVDLPMELSSRLNGQSEVVDLTGQIDSIQELLGHQPATTPASGLNIPDANGDLAARLHVPEDWLQECIDLLRDRPQLIFYGPPGTGKTYLAKEIARYIAGDSNVKIVQFHPAYSYEDFFEGYRPAELSKGQVGFDLKPGPLRSLVDRAVENPDATFVLIIDEINRGNLAKIFGELYFLLEYRNESIDLMYRSDNAKQFNLPRNVILIGTMNTADRSIALVDAAMRRRFAFLPLHPSESPTNGILRSWLTETDRPREVADLLDELNSLIDDEDFKIGPSYVMREAVYQPGGLDRVWRTAILPLLEEFHYGDRGIDIRSRYGLEAVRRRLDAKTTANSGPETFTDDVDSTDTD